MIALENLRIEIENPTDEAADIMRCLAVLYGTVSGECALDRDFGLNGDNVDMPMPAAQALIAADIIEKTRRYEPRASVRRVEWSSDGLAGRTIPKVVISI